MTAPFEKYKTYFVAIRDYLIEVGMERSDFVEGADPDSIRETEEKLGIRLPLAYKAWLEVFGKRASTVLDEHYTYTLKDLVDAYHYLSKTKLQFTGWQNLIYIGYATLNANFTMLGNDGDDPFVAFADGIDEELDSDMILGNTFTSWTRMSIVIIMLLKCASLRYRADHQSSIKRIALFEKKDWIPTLVTWLSLGPEHRKIYRIELKKFTAIIEEEDRTSDHFTLPDEFQHRWINYLKENNLFYLLDDTPNLP